MKRLKARLRNYFPLFYDKAAMLAKPLTPWLVEKRRLLALQRYETFTTGIFGTPFLFSDSLSFISAYEEIFQHEQYMFGTSNKQPYIVDAGSNIGLSVLFFKTKYPAAEITAIEPDPYLFEILTQNVMKHQLTAVNLVNAAVWDTEGFQFFEQDKGMSGKINMEEDGIKNIRVTTHKLSNYLTKKVDLLKIDIEGAEWNCLKECAHLLHLVQHIVVEHHSREAEPQHLHEMLALLSMNGFRYYVKETFCGARPLMESGSMMGFDFQANVFGTKG